MMIAYFKGGPKDKQETNLPGTVAPRYLILEEGGRYIRAAAIHYNHADHILYQFDPNTGSN